jgi:hypothetical protein
MTDVRTPADGGVQSAAPVVPAPPAAPMRGGTAVVVAREYARLAALLRSLPDEHWASPTGCPALTVRDMAAHVLGATEATRRRWRWSASCGRAGEGGR